MPAALPIRGDVPPEVLRRRARREGNGRVVSRMLALAHALEGMDRGQAAHLAGMERVSEAMKRIYGSRPWTDPQRRWLKRIAEQLVREVVVDRDSFDREPFQAHGGFRRLNKVFDGKLENIISDINEEMWRAAA